MALIVEDGTGLATAESYLSVADADTYHSNRGNDLWATMSTVEKEEALRRGTDHMVQAYRNRWAGYRLTSTQALDWPRAWVPMKDAPGGYGCAYYASDSVPKAVKDACALMAFKAAAGDLAPDLGRSTTREKVGEIEVEYGEGGRQWMSYRAIDLILAPLLSGTAGSVPVVRA